MFLKHFVCFIKIHIWKNLPTYPNEGCGAGACNEKNIVLNNAMCDPIFEIGYFVLYYIHSGQS